MRELIPDLIKWHQSGKKASLATVINTWGSSPRPAGSHMAVCSDGHFCGSVSGGCVESAVIAESLEVIKTGKARMLHFGVSDESAWEVGLACGGEIDVFVQPIEWSSLIPILTQIQAGKLVWYRLKLDESGHIENIPAPDGVSSPPLLEKDEEKTSFIDRILPPRQLVIIGGVNLAQPLTELARELDYSVIVIDPRKAFLTRERFPNADRLVDAWPEDAFKEIALTPATAVAVLSHDDKLDLPALEYALRSPVFYLGALGSQSTQQRRQRLLADKGIEPEALSRIKGPIGLNLGGSNPAEIALAILAEITAEYHRK